MLSDSDSSSDKRKNMLTSKRTFQCCRVGNERREISCFPFSRTGEGTHMYSHMRRELQARLLYNTAAGNKAVISHSSGDEAVIRHSCRNRMSSPWCMLSLCPGTMPFFNPLLFSGSHQSAKQ